MSQHHLMGRTEHELLWFRRREALAAAAGWLALGGLPGALAQGRGNVVELLGEVRLNGERLRPEGTVQTGDRLETGPGSRLVFVVGNSALHVRQNTRLTVERGASLNTVSLLRLVSGAVLSVFGPGAGRRAINTPTLTAGIRGTGVYTEVMPTGRTYFCNCYGEVDLSAGGQGLTSRSSYHQSFWGEVEPRDGRLITPAGALNHTDEEVEFLARLIGQRTAWQIAGRKGVKDGKGYMPEQTSQPHPAQMPVPR